MGKIEEYLTDELFIELLGRLDSNPGEFNNCLKELDAENLSKLRKALSVTHYKSGEITFKTNDYENSTIDRSILVKTDKSNDCYDLILNSPTTIVSCYKKDDLRRTSIYDAKRLLEMSVFNKRRGIVENALTSSLPYFGNKDAIKFRDAINFYEEQVLRQATETDDLEQNLFALNKEAKELIVCDNYKEIVDYFNDNAEEFVWGVCSSNAKMVLERSKARKTYQQLRISENLVRIVSNYTTLGELEKGVIKTKVLDRFITKKKQNKINCIKIKFIMTLFFIYGKICVGEVI